MTITSTDPAEAEQVAAEVGAKGAAANRDAVAGAEAVILAVPFDAVQAIVDELRSDLDGKS